MNNVVVKPPLGRLARGRSGRHVHKRKRPIGDADWHLPQLLIVSNEADMERFCFLDDAAERGAKDRQIDLATDF
ncbi:hypothetical protein ES703_91540 [subsurface metagenome]